MNPFEELLAQTAKNEMIRSQSFDLSNSGFPQRQTPLLTVSTAIENDPARMASFLSHQESKATSRPTLETIYENLPAPVRKTPFQLTSSNFQWNQNKELQSSEKTNTSIRGSVSSWNL